MVTWSDNARCKRYTKSTIVAEDSQELERGCYSGFGKVLGILF